MPVLERLTERWCIAIIMRCTSRMVPPRARRSRFTHRTRSRCPKPSRRRDAAGSWSVVDEDASRRYSMLRDASPCPRLIVPSSSFGRLSAFATAREGSSRRSFLFQWSVPRASLASDRELISAWHNHDRVSPSRNLLIIPQISEPGVPQPPERRRWPCHGQTLQLFAFQVRCHS